ncbi:DUF945 family protein [Pseudoduganella violacea]|uniref:Uncharacterized protein YdgA (DUF945 family) n=1 Tax=Pseudoduganella violacea TaxID=1715466 RepID=A0A7W5FWM8_9BURK|nr:DUF945 family protein [Pseudoduganella violacea]MBB3122029.1 uncharacterized protein YdgA (DUF945 family) [Pseudoduganella violacea]
MKHALLRNTFLLAALAPQAFAAPAPAKEKVITVPTLSMSAQDNTQLIIAPREIRTTGPRGADELWFGNARVDIPSVYFSLATLELKFGAIQQNVRTTTRGKLADSQSDTRLASVEVFGQRIEDVHLGVRFEKFDLAEMHKVEKDAAFLSNAFTSIEAFNAKRGNVLMAMARSAARHGSRVVLDDFSLSYKNFRARMTGHFGLRDASEKDLASIQQILKKVDGRIEISVPAGIPRAMCQAFVHTVPNIKGTAMERWQQQQNCYQAAMTKIVGEGWARMDEGVLRSSIVISQGKLNVNGKSTEVNLSID